MKHFQQNFRWCCGPCWHGKQLLQPIYGKTCHSCGIGREQHQVHKAEAAGMALRDARDGKFEIVDFSECPGCQGDHRVTGLLLCTSCDSNWFAGWEFKGFVEHFMVGKDGSGWGLNEKFEIIPLTE